MMAKPEWENLAFKIFEETHGREKFISLKEKGDQRPAEASVGQSLQKCLADFTSNFKPYKGNGNVGIGASGLATVVAELKFPPNELFTPGRSFPIHLRHGNFKEFDDAAMDIRTAALKLGQEDSGCLLDLVFHTGEEAPFWNIDSFEKLLSAHRNGPEEYRDYLLSDPWSYFIAVNTSRRAPTSFTDQRYYSWLVYNFKADDNVERRAKFRLVPEDGRPETGLLTEKDQRKPWHQFRDPEEKRSQRYLTKEFVDVLTERPVKYKLQMQLHQTTADQSHLILHPGRAWAPDTHPWIDVADVSLTTPLPPEVVQRCWAEVAYSHPTLQACTEPGTIHAYGLPGRALRHLPGLQAGGARPGADNLFPTKKYVVQVETGDRHGSGTDAIISIVMIGTKGRTDSIKLDRFLKNDLEAGSKCEFHVAGPDVGEILMIKLQKEKGGFFPIHSNWFVSRVHITTENPVKVYQFPAYRWVVTDVTLFRGEALTAVASQHEAIKNQRRLEIQCHQEIFQWGDNPAYSVDLPGFVKADGPDSLPKDVQFTDEATGKLHKARRLAVINLGLGSLFNAFNAWDELEDFRTVVTPAIGHVPVAADLWRSDTWYGAHYLNGCNPDTIRRCDKIPANFPVTQELVQDSLDRNVSLSKAVKDGRIFIVDNKILEDIPHFGHDDPEVERRYTSASMGLFYARNDGELVPIAIQMHQEPSDTNPIWTPKDAEYDWLYAKMCLRNADSQYHQMITHLMRTHLFMEPVNVATWRQLSTLHPVWKLLFPHMRGIFAINTLGRGVLIAPGGVADKTLSIGGGGHVAFMQKYYRSVTWDTYDFPKMFAERGVDNVQKLPKFYYRDDALMLWNAIAEFVKGIIFLYYANNDDLKKDQEIQNWAKDMSENGYKPGNGGVDKRTPRSFEDRESLVLFLTKIVFTSSCQHAAVNFSQMDTFGFAPNSPSLLRQPPPQKKGEVTLQQIMDALPTRHQTAIVLATVYDLTRLYPTEKFLGDFTESFFTDVQALDVIARFKGKLGEVTEAINKRNEGLEVPYRFLLPERIPNSIAI